jgi:hypothetical protein
LATFASVVPAGLIWARFEHVSLKKSAVDSKLDPNPTFFGLDLADSTPRAKSASPTKTAPVAKAARGPQTRVTKAKPVDSKAKPAKKAVKAKAKPSAPTKPVAKKKLVAVPAKSKPVKKSASKRLSTLKKVEIVSPKSSLPAAKKNAVGSKAKPTRSVAKKAPSSPRASQTKPVPASRKGSGGRSDKTP